MKHQKTGKYPVRNHSTAAVEYQQMSNEELKRYAWAQLGHCGETIKKD
jgi:hypothetical protein